MAQAQAQTVVLTGIERGKVATHGMGLFARMRVALAASAERSRQRHSLAGYGTVQELGRQTGTRG